MSEKDENKSNLVPFGGVSPDTMIVMPYGGIKPIGDIEEGEYVTVLDKYGEFTEAEVVGVVRGFGTMVMLSTDNVNFDDVVVSSNALVLSGEKDGEVREVAATDVRKVFYEVAKPESDGLEVVESYHYTISDTISLGEGSWVGLALRGGYRYVVCSSNYGIGGIVVCGVNVEE